MLEYYDYSCYLSTRNKAILAMMFDVGSRTTETISIRIIILKMIESS